MVLFENQDYKRIQMPEADKKIQAYLDEHIRNIPDFPKPGIQFKDITPLLLDPESFKSIPVELVKPFQGDNIDYVAGIESRGFLYGTIMASVLGAGFITVRKPGKLPADTIRAEYELEYGTDELHMHKDAIKPGSKVLIHDDLIATGGSAKAAAELIKKLDGQVAGFSFIMELSFLNGRNKIDDFGPVKSLIAYD